MITYEGHPRHEDVLLRDCGLEHWKSCWKTAPWDEPAFLAKNTLAGANVPANLRNLFIALDRPDVQFASSGISRAMAQPTINADEILKGLARYHLRRGCCGATRDSPRLPRSRDSALRTGQHATWHGRAQVAHT